VFTNAATRARQTLSRFGRSSAAAVLALLCAAATAAPAAGGGNAPRVALVIGNAAYPTMPLANPLNDARAIADTLEKLGFQVIRVENAKLPQMFDAVRQFGTALKSGVGLFYYAGHGAQVKGRNYLLPVDASITNEDEVAYKAFDVGLVLEKMEAAKNPLNVVILDACRNNPFARNTRSITGGLAQMDAPAGAIVAFATAPGAEAADGSGKNGLYTTYLLRYMATPGLKVEDVFKRTRVAVKQDSAGRQIPWESTSLEGDFYFTPPAAGAAPAPDPARLDDELWALVESSDTPSAYRAYIEKYPSGAHVNEARSRATPKSKPAAAPQARSNSGFSFSAEEARMDRATTEGRAQQFQSQLAAGCPPARRNARLRIELQDGGTRSSGLAGALGEALAERLRQAGLKLAGSGPADYRVQGTVGAQASSHRVLRLNQVTLNAAFAVSTMDGQNLASHVTREESFAGADMQAAMADIVAAQAIEIAGLVYTDLCKK